MGLRDRIRSAFGRTPTSVSFVARGGYAVGPVVPYAYQSYGAVYAPRVATVHAQVAPVYSYPQASYYSHYPQSYGSFNMAAYGSSYGASYGSAYAAPTFAPAYGGHSQAASVHSDSYAAKQKMVHREETVHRDDMYGNHEDRRIHEDRLSSEQSGSHYAANSYANTGPGYGGYGYGHASGSNYHADQYRNNQAMTHRTEDVHRTDAFGGHMDSSVHEDTLSNSQYRSHEAGSRGHVGSMYSSGYPAVGYGSPSTAPTQWVPARYGC